MWRSDGPSLTLLVPHNRPLPTYTPPNLPPLSFLQSDWVNPSKIGGMNKAFQGLAGLLLGAALPAGGKPCPSRLFSLDLHYISNLDTTHDCVEVMTSIKLALDWVTAWCKNWPFPAGSNG